MKLVPIGDSLVPLVGKLNQYFVRKTGDTMTGMLTSPHFRAQTPIPDFNGPTPSASRWERGYVLLDDAGNPGGFIGLYYGSDGTTACEFSSCRYRNNGWVYNYLSSQIRQNGYRLMEVGADEIYFPGRISLTTHGGSWISQVSAQAPFVISPAIPTDGSRYDAIMRGTFTDGSSWTVGGIEKSLDIAYFAAGRTANGFDGRIRFSPSDGRILARGSSPRMAVGSEVGGSNQTGGGIGAGMYTDGEGGNIWWTAPDGSYNEIDSYDNTRSRIYTHTSNGTWGGVYWTRAKSYNLDYMHAWTHLAYWTGTGQIGWDWSDYNEFLVIILRDSNYMGSAVIQRDWLQDYAREVYTGGGMYAAGGQSGRFAAMSISRTTAKLSAVTVDSAVVTGACGAAIYGRR